MKLYFTIGILLLLTLLYSKKFKKENLEAEPIVLSGKISNAKLKTFNGCGIGNFLIPSTGNIQEDRPPLLGSISYNWNLDYRILDTIPGKLIKGVAFKRNNWNENTSIIEYESGESPYVIISDTGLFKYAIPFDFDPYSENIVRTGALFIPNILKVADEITTDKNDPIVLLTGDSNYYNISYFSYPELEEQFSFKFTYYPDIFEVINGELFIISSDSNDVNQLYHFDSLQDSIYQSYQLDDSTTNAQEIIRNGDSLHILSSPGDTMVISSYLNLQNGQLSQSLIYSQSGARATHNAYKSGNFFTFQPAIDSTNTVLDKQILILNPASNQLDTLILNIKLDYFKHPLEADPSFGQFYMKWIGAKWEDIGLDSVYINQYDDQIIKIETGAFPQFINATYGCWVNVKEIEEEQVNFQYYPNPASSQVTINLTGLIKGKQYDLSILDSSGKELYIKKLEPYQLVDLPLDNYSQGIYYLKLKTKRKTITKKLIIK